MNLCNYQELRALLLRHGFHFSKAQGQNFLLDEEILRDIAAASGADQTCGVLEIGSGAGTLTRELSQRAGVVIAIELDKTLLPVLSETLSDCANVKVVHGDALHLDLDTLVREHFQGLTPIVCANLPYHITSPVLERLAKTPCFQTLTVLVQKEVARRLAAPSGSSDIGAFALLLQYRMEIECLFDVPPDRFFPVPKVTSTLLRCVRRTKPAVEVSDEAFFFRVIRGGFFLRRKTLSNSLSAAGFDKEQVLAALNTMGLPSSIRGERLTLQNYADLSRILQMQCGS